MDVPVPQADADTCPHRRQQRASWVVVTDHALLPARPVMEQEVPAVVNILLDVLDGVANAPSTRSSSRGLRSLRVGKRQSPGSCNPLVGFELLVEKRDALGLPIVDPATECRNKKVQRRKDVVHPAILSRTDGRES